MRAEAVGFFLALMTHSADARCYSVWHYPSPQRCAERVAQQQDPPVPPAKPDEPLPGFTIDKYNTIILTPKPGRTDEEGRADAIKILRQVLQ